MRVLLDLRPALAGHAGIPQEARLLHWGLTQRRDLNVVGLLQSGHLVLPGGAASRPGVPAGAVWRALAMPRKGRWLQLARAFPVWARAVAQGLAGREVPLPCVVGDVSAAAWWPHLFGPTLERERAFGDLHLKLASWPWMAAHAGGVATRAFGGGFYPRIDTKAFDVFVAQTPYPGRVSRCTSLVVRYHDAVPLLMPSTTRSGRWDTAAHASALQLNVADGAWFACVSEAARSQLAQVSAQAARRSVVIPNMLSPEYRLEPADEAQVPRILQARSRTLRKGPAGAGTGPQGPPRFLLAVSTIEPRKNHLRLIEAWERLRQQGYDDLQLVVVGSPGWQHQSVLDRLRPWLEQGLAHHLEGVETPELRLLYATAAATVCPALDEGFGYSPLESMASGGLVVVSDIPAHREVCGGAAEYFDPLDACAIAAAIRSTLEAPAMESLRRRQSAGPQRAGTFASTPLSERWRDWLRSLPKGRPSEKLPRGSA